MLTDFFKKVIFVVIFSHLCFIVFFLSFPTKKTPIKQQISVKTFSPPPTKTYKKKSVKTHQKTHTARKKTPQKQAPISKKKPTYGKKLKLDKLHKILNQKENKILLPQTSKNLKIPKLPKLKIDLNHSNEACMNQYIHSLVSRLKSSLKLPGIGRVTLKICINKNGKIENLTILETKSEQNMLYLKNNLHKMSFPCFNDYMLKNKNIAFTITFYNE